MVLEGIVVKVPDKIIHGKNGDLRTYEQNGLWGGARALMTAHTVLPKAHGGGRASAIKTAAAVDLVK